MMRAGAATRGCTAPAILANCANAHPRYLRRHGASWSRYRGRRGCRRLRRCRNGRTHLQVLETHPTLPTSGADKHPLGACSDATAAGRHAGSLREAHSIHPCRVCARIAKGYALAIGCRDDHLDGWVKCFNCRRADSGSAWNRSRRCSRRRFWVRPKRLLAAGRNQGC